MMTLHADRVYVDGAFREAYVTCENGRITGVTGERPAGEVRELGAAMLIPGLIDAHTHGAAGVDVNAADAEGLRTIARFFASQGTTAWLASVLTDTEETTAGCLAAIRSVMDEGSGGAQLMGAHLEGPFLAPAYKGAMPEHLLRKGDAALLRRYQQAFPGVVKYLTVSPEVEGVPEMIREVKDDVAVAIGHSGATHALAMEAFAAGARCATHTFNAMRPLHHHEVGIAGAALESDCWCEMICDGCHLAPATVRLIIKCKGLERVMAVTDSIMAAGLPDGNYKLGVNDVVVEDGDAKLADTGVRAGSTLTTGQALRNLVKFTGRPLEEIIPVMTANPAAALRIDDRKGRIAPGMDADFVVLDDALTVRETIVAGETVYSA